MCALIWMEDDIMKSPSWIKNGGSAFPNAGEDSQSPWKELPEGSPWMGLTKRDWFAGRALTGILANLEGITGRRDWTQGLPHGLPQYVSLMAYTLADAMLEARKTQGR